MVTNLARLGHIIAWACYIIAGLWAAFALSAGWNTKNLSVALIVALFIALAGRAARYVLNGN